ncbi:hypothetical protein OSB04_023335 [Centaurea solstitialis]|uniref:F-box domain-containing protein n=1 Tax=Centaurea solstitialis TaxID=347529 RepID=A0AA38SJN8_9ASTR|nr:hypothetical protein OSB04_023335 [Centaurea solstitialis]
MEALPAELTIDILSRLPVKTIIHCKLVCKKWRNLFSDSLFVNLHLSRSPTGQMGSVNGLICIREYSFVHDNVYICNPVTREIMTISNDQFYTKFSRINAYGFGVASSTGEYKVVRTFKWLTSDGDKFLWGEVYTLGTGQWRRLGRVPYLLDNSDFGVVLNDHCHWIVHDSEDAPEKICTFDLNKETFQLFPSPPLPPSKAIRDSGSQFQRLAILKGCLCKTDGNGDEWKKSDGDKFLWGEVYTLGTGQWRRLGRVPHLLDYSYFGVVLNDHCHWIVHDSVDAPEKICTFDLNKETFQLFPSPPPPPSKAIRDSGSQFQRLAILKGCLCKTDGNGFPFTIWVMKEYGIKKSWHKVVVITKEALNRSRELRFYNYDVYLIGCLKDTIFFMSGDLFAFYPRSDTIEKIEMFEWPDGGLAYCPSFLKLQNFETEKVFLTGIVNGLICLSQLLGPEGHNTCICNPITGECIIFPRHQYHVEKKEIAIYGFRVI